MEILPNRPFRRALLSLYGLAPPSASDGLRRATNGSVPEWIDGMVRRLGFVQVDSVSAVERAQHHILFSRNRRYTQEELAHCLEERRSLFENWTHDAAILPISFYPYWKRYFQRFNEYLLHPGYRRYFSGVNERDLGMMVKRVTEEGALKPRDFDSGNADWGYQGKRVAEQTKDWRSSKAKVGLERLWRTGVLAVTGRDKREKVYDLAERVIPDEYREAEVSEQEFVDWVARAALARLGAATPRQIAHFFEALSTREAQEWCDQQHGGDLIQVRLSHADRSTSPSPHFTTREFVETLAEVPPPTRRLRLLNPFDPLIRDRQRAQRIFGFEYTIEIFVPPKKRKYGYYVLPILEGERFTGRVDCKVDRRRRVFHVLGLWWESGIKKTPRRGQQLERELLRLAKFCGADALAFAKGYDRR